MKDPIGKTISSIHRHTQIHIARSLISGKCPVGPGQIYIYIVIGRNEGLSQKDVVKKLMIEKATVAKGVKKLVEDDFVQIEEDADDKRYTRLFLTEKGRKEYPKISRFFHEVNTFILKDFTTEEIDMLNQFLEKMNRNLLTELDDIKEKQNE